MEMKPLLETLTPYVQAELEGCITLADSGVLLYTPDGVGNYDALWTRDFAYMVEYSGELLPAVRVRDCLAYTLDHARPQDGWIPDRVDAKGMAVYSAGSPEHPCGEPNLDNGPFAAIIAFFLLDRLTEEEGKAFLAQYGSALYRGLASIPLGKNGLVYNDPEKPHSPYGFTDCICKTGLLMKESLLYWRGCRMLAALFGRLGVEEAWSKELDIRAKAVEEALEPVFAHESGMLLAATETCRQIDVWGSCYAVSIGFPLSPERKAAIADWLVQNREGILEKGQLRHTAPGEFWEKCLEEIPRGAYQNGAYWATATGWYVDAVKGKAPALAQEVLDEVCQYFEEQGIFECVNGPYQKLSHYVVSATNVYGAVKKFAKEGEGC